MAPQLSRWLLLAAWIFGAAACADPVDPVDPVDLTMNTRPDAGPSQDAGPSGTPGRPSQVQARGLSPVVGQAANGVRVVRARVSSPAAGIASGPRRVVRTMAGQ